ncbi:hypothetical protein SI859A1_01339 [Aurantimonas manganoxydans SI85-9A1]|uniref:Uncharacterized protein n=1 Tax=Aurantimonas manganoxydans (strain ATCC BAA-1229 / DSM 21871 / SI85-9A1) TaxID=287752 RepID=Q1YIY0_AURMS|nr:hypothetical protein SI859A1_01339 [Aurantimonas manganoxydans SI85-9A1]
MTPSRSSIAVSVLMPWACHLNQRPRSSGALGSLLMAVVRLVKVKRSEWLSTVCVSKGCGEDRAQRALMPFTASAAMAEAAAAGTVGSVSSNRLTSSLSMTAASTPTSGAASVASTWRHRMTAVSAPTYGTANPVGSPSTSSDSSTVPAW